MPHGCVVAASKLLHDLYMETCLHSMLNTFTSLPSAAADRPVHPSCSALRCRGIAASRPTRSMRSRACLHVHANVGMGVGVCVCVALRTLWRLLVGRQRDLLERVLVEESACVRLSSCVRASVRVNVHAHSYLCGATNGRCGLWNPTARKNGPSDEVTDRFFTATRRLRRPFESLAAAWRPRPLR